MDTATEGVLYTDVLSKLKNTQYLLINFLEAPVLAFILAYFLKYYQEGAPYIFRENINVPAYIFMCVIVALFMGLTVSAEEIIRDRKILKREEFLNLSRGSYLFSKILVLLVISAIQTFSFVLIGNNLFEVKGMFTDYWLMLFTISCFGNMMGLNISTAFNSAVTIYILIPFLIIPQIILSGVMVKFEQLNPNVTTRTRVPFIGEIMASRWAFEALAVNQYKNNRYERNFFDVDKEISEIVYRKDFWMVMMNDKLDSLKKGLLKPGHEQLLTRELSEAVNRYPSVVAAAGKPGSNDAATRKFLGALKKHLMSAYKNASAKKDRIVKKLESENPEPGYLKQLKADHTNENLEDLVTTTSDFNFIIEDNNRFVRRFRPVLMDGPDDSFIRSQFFVSRKNIFGNYYSTWYVNLGVIWAMSALLMLTLYHNTLRKFLGFMEAVLSKKYFTRK